MSPERRLRDTPHEARKAEFDQFSDDYQELVDQSVKASGESGEYFADYKARFIAKRIASRPSCRILDYGCGVGLVCRSIRRQLPHARIDGFDISQRSLDRVDSALKMQGTFTSKISDLARNYDVIVLANVLHHTRPQDRQLLLCRVMELLRAEGNLVVFEHNPANPLTRRAVKSCPFDGDAILLPPRETVGYLTQSGLQSVRLEYIVFFPRALHWLRPLEPSLAWCPVGAQYAVTGRAL